MPHPPEITLLVLIVVGNSHRKTPQFWLGKKTIGKTQLSFDIDMFDLHESIVADFFLTTLITGRRQDYFSLDSCFLIPNSSRFPLGSLRDKV